MRYLNECQYVDFLHIILEYDIDWAGLGCWGRPLLTYLNILVQGLLDFARVLLVQWLARDRRSRRNQCKTLIRR